MDSLTLATLDTRLQESQGDYLPFTTTTLLTNNNSIISTELRSFDFAGDDCFKNWWVYIVTSTNNSGVERRVSAYTTSTGALTIYGVALTAGDGTQATVQVSRYRRTDRVKALNDAIRETAYALHKRIDNQILITGNVLPNAHFEDWTLTTVPDKYAVSSANITSVEETTIKRGGTKSMKATTGAGGAGAYIKLTTANYPRLLDLSGQTVTIKVWVYCTKANDAFIQIYTKNSAGTTQTLTSTTVSLITTWTLITLEDQVLNDDLVDCEIRFGITSLSQSVYFDDARLIGLTVHEYMLPEVLNDGLVESVQVQNEEYEEDEEACDIIAPQEWVDIQGYVINDGANKWLRIEDTLSDEYRIRLFGSAPFTALSASTDAIVIDQHRVPMLIAYAKYLYYNRYSQPVSSQDVAKFRQASIDAYAEYMRLAHLAMATPSIPMRFG